jgi:DNA-binding winged helix-turn-helix (wHTH) protein
MTSPKVTSTRRNIDTPVHFGAYEINPVTGELRKDGMLVHLPRQAAQLLLLLLEEPGCVRTREELKRTLWIGETYGDFDHGLNKCVYSLRAALGDLARSPRWIETLSGQGYRFIGALRVESASVSPPRRWAEMPMAVMPFAVVSPDLSWLSAQIAAQVIDELSRVAGLKVLAYSHVRSLLSREDMQVLHEKFGARAVVLGDLKVERDELYVHAEMVDSLNGMQMWGLHSRMSLRRKDCAESIAEGIVSRVKKAHAREYSGRGIGAGGTQPESWSTLAWRIVREWQGLNWRGGKEVANRAVQVERSNAGART